MALFIVRREIQGVSREDMEAALLRTISCSYNFEGMKWVTSYWDAEVGRAYCVYEAQSVEQLREHAERSRVPCDEVLSVVAFSPENFVTASGPVSAPVNS